LAGDSPPDAERLMPVVRSAQGTCESTEQAALGCYAMAQSSV
jgi:hypothetical protein